MDQDILRKGQLAQLEMAKEIRRVCEENDLRHWLDSGILHGAVRHQGFIPWDNDMDVGMPREDYVRFCKIAHTMKKDLVIGVLGGMGTLQLFIYFNSMQNSLALRKNGIDLES